MTLQLEEVATTDRRARELYKYFVPSKFDAYSSQSSVPDTVLTAHAQLVAWRLNCRRAMVSLIDRDIQYFVAEASKTLDLNDATLSDDPSDALWAGCINVPKAGRLCEHTIAQLPKQEGDLAYFEVTDLTKDDRFNALPFVTGDPHFRYYCGVPLRTKNGIPIGSFFACMLSNKFGQGAVVGVTVDDKVREPIKKQDLQFLATMTENVMTHYENMKEKEDRKRVLNMNMCLAAFVDPENQVKKRKRRHGTQTKSGAGSRQQSDKEDSPHPNDAPRIKSTRFRKTSRDRYDSEVSSEHTTSSFMRRVEEDDNIDTFKRAADLLHAALSLGDEGGVVFLDTTTSYRSRHQQRRRSDRSSDGAGSERDNHYKRRSSVGAATLHSTSSWGPPQRADPPDVAPLASRPADVLAATTSPPYDNDDQRSERFSPLTHEDLARLIKKHPRGKFFDLDPEGFSTTSSSGEDRVYDIPRSKRRGPSTSEAAILTKHFPHARQVIFLPLWDSSTSRWSTLFAYTVSDYRSFASNPDFLYCIAFCNCVMAEISRIATFAADQQKSDFIGSVSHELRSPLHGILASCEFLADTTTSTFQQSLIDTADSCARTLLDTINMVLDYSKINAFERNARKARKKRGEADSVLALAGQPQLNIFGDVDLAAITEEVVEGVATGQVFKDSLTGMDSVDLSVDAPKNFLKRKDVEVILDIAPPTNSKDWIFVTQPGAFRRVIMNIFGNALKYTQKGYIKVKLECLHQRRLSVPSVSDDPLMTVIKLTIIDTGIGMSNTFMRTKLYTPFAQENSIAPGTGLGLSLVKSIIVMLNGEINIQSEKGVGTEVTVLFPMTPASEANSSESASASTPPSSGSIERAKDDSLYVVQKKSGTRRAILYPDTISDTSSEALGLIRDAVSHYLGGWFGFDLGAPFSVSNLPDIIVADESDLASLVNVLPGGLESPDGPMIVVLCQAASRKAGRGVLSSSPRIEAVSYPFGPFKLAKSIKWCLERLDRSLVRETEAETQATLDADSTVEHSVEEVAQAVEQMTLKNPDPSGPDVSVIKSGALAANEDSVHAQLVLESSTEEGSSGGLDDTREYPFPIPIQAQRDGTVSPSDLEAAERTRPSLATRKTIAPTVPELATHVEAATPMSSKGVIAAAALQPNRSPPATAPRLLLVDDNKVNLRLLQTFMKKRKYTDVYSAEDGAQAVFQYREMLLQDSSVPIIVFMDISMPIKNGFQATREIREIEAEHREQFPNPMQKPPSALIIALTGLASGRDQSEAFTSGFDLYLCKPVSFREVGRLLDNWEKSGGAATVGVPHGAVSGQSIPTIHED